MTDIIDQTSHTQMRVSGAVVEADSVLGDAVPRFQRDDNGLFTWGSGAAAPDVILGRNAAGVLAFVAGLLASQAPINCTAATLTLSPLLHDGRIVTLNKADGIAVTLPAATGSGAKYELFIGTTITSVGTTIKVANASDTMVGFATLMQDGGNTALLFEYGGTDDTITMDGSTKGGIKGDTIRLTDIAANLWRVEAIFSGTGTEVVNNSATV